MSAVWLSATCRVCLASDREMYRLANTTLEGTYERVTSGTLAVEGRPCCVCGVCLSALRRCRRFIDTAREANDALDRWIRNHPNTDTLTELPLFSFTQSPMKIFEFTCQESGIQEPGVKQERDIAVNEDSETIHHQNKGTYNIKGNILMVEVKCEVASDDDNDNKMSDNIGSHNTQVSSNSECTNVYDDMIDIEIETQTYDVKSDNVRDKPAPTASNVGSYVSSDDDIPLKTLRPGKRLNEDIESGPEPKKDGPITSEHHHGNLNPPAALHTEEDMFSCPQCNYNTTNKYTFNEHFKKHSVEQPGTNNSKNLNKHLIIVTGKKQFFCHKCNYKCGKKSNLKRHFLTHTAEKPFSCDKCDYTCNHKINFQQHLLTHTGEKPFECNICHAKFSAKTRLKRHSLVHTGEKLFSCFICDFKCSIKSNLKQHFMTHTGEKRFACDKCDYKCNHKFSLKQHLLTHTGEKPFSCNQCHFKCNNRSNLKHHLLTHADQKPFSCDKCDFRCVQKGNLKQHLLTHTGAKPFACDKCDFKCNYRGSLKLHILRHTNEKLFSCDKCDFKCIQKGNLKQHLLTHTGDKPFACDKCDFKCIQKGNLKKHLLTHTCENPIFELKV